MLGKKVIRGPGEVSEVGVNTLKRRKTPRNRRKRHLNEERLVEAEKPSVLKTYFCYSLRTYGGSDREIEHGKAKKDVWPVGSWCARTSVVWG